MIENYAITDVIEYVQRSSLNMTNLNTVHKRKGRYRLYTLPANSIKVVLPKA